LVTISLPPPFPSTDTVHVSIVLTQGLKILPLQQKAFLVYPSTAVMKKAAQKVFPPSLISLPSLSPFTSLRTQPKEQTKNWNSLSLYGTTPGDAQTRFFLRSSTALKKIHTSLNKPNPHFSAKSNPLSLSLSLSLCYPFSSSIDQEQLRVPEWVQ
jgi:hypothetical protein